MKARRIGALLLVPVLLASLVLSSSLVLAVHDQAFQLDGDTSPTDLDPGPGTPDYDWEDLFDVVDGVASPKDLLPGGFISAFFARDFVPGESGPDRTTFATGSKDTLNITPGWQCARDNNVNDKTDLVNVYATPYVDPISGELKLYFALERYSNGGAGNVAFWFLQDGTVDCEAPASGPSTTDFTGNHRDGDLLIVSEFTVGGTVSTINAYEWVGGAAGFLNTTAVASGADCKDDETGGDTICATVNTTAFTSPWLTETKQSGPGYSNELDVSEFFEGGISLTGLGLADRCFARVLADTRSSPSLTATIFDFAMGDLSVCDLTVTKDGDTVSKVGDDVDYTITIENSGGVTLYKQSIVDSLLGDLTDGTNALITSSDCGASLAPGDSCTINVTRTVQAGDDDPLPNTVTVVYDSRSDLLGDEVTRSDDHSVDLVHPGVSVTKTGPDRSKDGDDVTYTIEVCNTGDVDLVEESIVDDLLGDLAASYDDDLTVGECESHDFLYTVDEAATGDPVVNTVEVHYNVGGTGAVLTNDITDNASHSVDLIHPSFTVAKTCDAEPISYLGPANFTVTIENTGDVPLIITADDGIGTFTLDPNTGPQYYPVSLDGPFTAGGTADNTVTASWTLPELYGLSNTDTKSATDSCDVLQPVFETAYAMGDDAVCFTDLGAGNWGWVNGNPPTSILPGTYTWPVWAGAAHCDTNNGTLVGTVTVNYDGIDVFVTWNIDSPNILGDTHVYAGLTQVPSGGFSPGQWEIESPFNGEAIYIILHAVVGVPQ